MIDQILIKECCLCKACFNVCPVGAISFDILDHGFQYPRIDGDKCIHCNQCEKVCPHLHGAVVRNKKAVKSYAAISMDDDNRFASSSGGIFFEIAKKVIKENGYVCGVIMDEQFQVHHVVTNDIQIVKQMRGSKYVQSDIQTVYQQVERLLMDQIPVLYCGCPCQVTGLNRYLGQEYGFLYCAEVICHGVPSQSLFDSYRDYLEKRFHSKICNIQFRNKKKGWHNSAVVIEFEKELHYTMPYIVDAYMKAMLSGVTLKETCYCCEYNNFRSSTDITLGDLWGGEVLAPEMDDNLGLSAVLVHTEKGKALLDSLNLKMIEMPLERIIQYNRNIIESTVKHPLREAFFSYATKEGYSKAWKHFFQETILQKYRRLSKYYLRCTVRRIQGRALPLY